jgi:hypothetical protein
MLPRVGQRSPSGGIGGAFDLEPDGEHATVVTEIYDCSSVPEVNRQQMDNGHMWIPSMTATLERLDGLCAAGLT